MPVQTIPVHWLKAKAMHQDAVMFQVQAANIVVQQLMAPGDSGMEVINAVIVPD